MASRPYKNFEGKTWTGEQRSFMAKRSKQMRKDLGMGANPECCDICGQTEGKLMYHNENYDTPLDDLWGLCWRCHMMWHSRYRAEDKVREYFDGILNRGIKWEPVYKHDFGVLWRDHGV